MKFKRLNNILVHALSIEGWVFFFFPLLSLLLMIINGGDVIYLYSCKARSSEMVGRVGEMILSRT